MRHKPTGAQDRNPTRCGRIILAGAITFSLCLLPPPAARAQDSSPLSATAKVSAEVEAALGNASPDDMVPVIVQTRGRPTSGHLAQMGFLGGKLKAVYVSIDGYAARIPAWRMSQLAAETDVQRVSFDSPVKAHLDVAYRSVKAHLVSSYVIGTPAGLDGTGVTIALVDTGVQLHSDLKRGKGLPQIVEVEIVGHENGLADYYGHGTHVAGIMNGNGYASSDSLSFRTFRGLAPGARLISIRAMSPDGTGYTSDIIKGIDWTIQNRQNYKIRVLNLSLGHPVYESYKDDPLCRAVERAVNQGIVVVVAAGNDGTVGTGFGTITSPANEPTAISVGAMDDRNTVETTDDVLAWYSSKGPSLIDFVVKPDLVAPGTWIVSTRATGSFLDTQHHDQTLQIRDYKNDPPNASKDGAYYTMAGTSASAPMVAGTAALMIQKDPTLNPATVKARLMKSAVKDGRLVFETGAGYLDMYGAVHATGSATTARSPSALPGSDGGVYLQDTAILWGPSWPMGAIWGGGKGSALGFSLTSVSLDIISAYGAIWGGNGGSQSLVENDLVTSSGAIWGGGKSSLLSTNGTVTNQGAIWGGGKK